MVYLGVVVMVVNVIAVEYGKVNVAIVGTCVTGAKGPCTVLQCS